MSRKDMRQLLTQLNDQGFEATRTGSGHWKVQKNGTGPAVFLPHSPSDHRVMHRLYQKLKSIGFERKRK